MSNKKKSPFSYLVRTIVLTAILLCFSFVWNLFDPEKKKDSNELPNKNTELVEDSNINRNSNDNTTISEKETYKSDNTNENEVKNISENLEAPAPIDGNILLYYTSYISSLNTQTLCPDYVAWCLTAERVQGNVKRKDKFTSDLNVDEKYRVEHGDYSYSGYERGHMCPVADNKNSEKAMEECFYMTNICPQNGNLNGGDWKELEELCRSWAIDYGNVYIAAGPIFDDGYKHKIGRNKNRRISVPTRFYKVVFINGRVPRAIGFIYPNSKTNKDIREYATSVDEVERQTNIDFFYNLPDEVEKEVESRCNPSEFNI